MTTNQTIDGVPLLPCPFCGGEPYGTHDHYVHDDLSPMPCVECRSCSAHLKAGDWNRRVKPAAQPQGEPVAFIQIPKNIEKYGHGNDPDRLKFGKPEQFFVDGKSPLFDFVLLYAEQPAPVAVVPDGYCIMPRRLTAENGAKALLLGEFKLDVTKECPECCELEEPTEGCEICDGEGEYGQQYTISWDQIKFIYSKAVSGLAVKTESAKSR